MTRNKTSKCPKCGPVKTRLDETWLQFMRMCFFFPLNILIYWYIHIWWYIFVYAYIYKYFFWGGHVSNWKPRFVFLWMGCQMSAWMETVRALSSGCWIYWGWDAKDWGWDAKDWGWDAYENHWFPLMLGRLLNLYFWGGGYLTGLVGWFAIINNSFPTKDPS